MGRNQARLGCGPGHAECRQPWLSQCCWPIAGPGPGLAPVQVSEMCLGCTDRARLGHRRLGVSDLLDACCSDRDCHARRVFTLSLSSGRPVTLCATAPAGLLVRLRDSRTVTQLGNVTDNIINVSDDIIDSESGSAAAASRWESQTGPGLR